MNKIKLMKIDYYKEIYNLWNSIPGIGLSVADSEENIKNFLIRNPGLSFVYIESNKIVGTILCGNDGRRGYIHHLAVNSNYRNKGIGKNLVETSLSELKKIGIIKCHLFVFQNNELGNQFWKNLGWTKRNNLFVFSKNI